MKTTLLLIALSLSITFSFCQTTPIPDVVFEQALIDYGIDTNGLNGNILNSDASTIIELSLSYLGISDLTGIEAFNSLTSLWCDNNSLTALNLSSITTLTSVDCSSNGLTSLNLGTNNLENLVCHSNSLTTLDLSSITTLISVDCSNNGLTSLNLGTNNLQYLYCNSNLITGLDLSDQTALIVLDCSQNQLTELKLKNGNNTAIQNFNAMDNPNLNCIEVDDTSYSDNNWTNVDPLVYFSKDCSNTQTIYIPDDNFEQALIDLYHDDVLDDYVLSDRIIGITTLDISSKGISDLTGIEGFTSLIDLNCYNNKISTLDFSSNTALEILICDKNLLTSLNITNNSALTDLSCGENYVTLTSIDVSQNLNLKSLNIQSNNWMNSLDVTNNTALEYLNTNGAPITNLDLTHNTALLGLGCQYSNLSTLDLSQNVALTRINASYNYLVDMDLSNNVNLTAIAIIYNNSLVSLNVKNGNNSNINSFSFNATHCNSLDCITVDDVAYSEANWSFGIDAGVIFSTNCALGVDDFNIDEVSIFPNPSKDKFNINLKINATYRLTNLFGQEVKKGFLVSGKNELETNTLSAGIYLLNIDRPEGKVTKKVIKQ